MGEIRDATGSGAGAGNAAGVAVAPERALPEGLSLAPHRVRLPGTVPIDAADWLRRGPAFAERMALRDRLMAERLDAVHACADAALPAARELLGLVLAHLARDPGYAVSDTHVVRPDGVRVARAGPPLLLAGRLVEEDLVLLEKPEGGEEHVLTGAILCFPSNWTLAQKFGRPLLAIHAPVESYHAAIGRRVQRLFDGLRPEAPLMRTNLLAYDHARLYNPRPEFERHRPPGRARFLRTERQVLLRLPESRAVVFSIHTALVEPAHLPEAERQALEAARPGAFVTGVEA